MVFREISQTFIIYDKLPLFLLVPRAESQAILGFFPWKLRRLCCDIPPLPHSPTVIGGWTLTPFESGSRESDVQRGYSPLALCPE